MSEARVILGELAMVESPRWHDGRLWFAHWGTDEVIAVDVVGNSEVVAHGPVGLGWSIDWLPDGRLLVTGEGLSRLEADGSRVPHVDLSGLAGDWNELVVDGRGNAYVNGGLFGPPEAGPSGIVALVSPDGRVRQVADGLAFPNGMAVMPDNGTLIVAESWAEQLTAYDIGDDGSLSGRRVWAATPGDHPDGICVDADGAAWYADVGNRHCVRVREGGDVLATVALDRGAFACMLGGPDGRTLFIGAAAWRGFEQMDEVIANRTGQVLVADAPAPHAGWPEARLGRDVAPQLDARREGSRLGEPQPKGLFELRPERRARAQHNRVEDEPVLVHETATHELARQVRSASITTSRDRR